MVDSTGLGDPIISDLRTLGLTIHEYQFTANSKRQLIDNLIIAIEQQEVSFPEIQELINELELFEYQSTANGVKYGAPSGYHDDCIISLGLAYQLVSRGTMSFIIEIPPLEEGYFDIGGSETFWD